MEELRDWMDRRAVPVHSVGFLLRFHMPTAGSHHPRGHVYVSVGRIRDSFVACLAWDRPSRHATSIRINLKKRDSESLSVGVNLSPHTQGRLEILLLCCLARHGAGLGRVHPPTRQAGRVPARDSSLV